MATEAAAMERTIAASSPLSKHKQTTVDASSPQPTRTALAANKQSMQWLTSPFPQLDGVYGSPGGNSMSSFCLSTPGFSPSRPSYGITPGSLQFRATPDSPAAALLKAPEADELASPFFSPSLFSPFDNISSRQIRKESSKLSLEQDFHDSKLNETSNDRLFHSLINNSGNGRYFRSNDLSGSEFDSSIAALPNLTEDEEESDNGSAATIPIKSHQINRPVTVIDNGDSHYGVSAPVDNGTPLTRNSSIPIYANYKSDINATFFSPAIPHRSKIPNMSPALSENSTPSHCNCKKSKCLKLYCECFAALRYCDSCNCLDCNNKSETESVRQAAIAVTKERNSVAFESKVSTAQGHATGCNCKRSMCLKKYCECFEGDAFCGDNCKCVSCLNYSGSEDLDTARNAKFKKTGVVTSVKEPKKTPPYGNIEKTEFVVPTSIPSIASASYNKKISTSTPESGDDDINEESRPLKKRKVSYSRAEPLYPFFGEKLPLTPKILALRCLEYLDGKNIYAMSQVNRLWSRTSMDDALWEANDD